MIYFMQLTHTFFRLSLSFNRPIVHRYTCHCTIFLFIILLIVSAIILISEHLHIVVNNLTSFIVAKAAWKWIINRWTSSRGNSRFSQLELSMIIWRTIERRCSLRMETRKREKNFSMKPVWQQKTPADPNPQSITWLKKSYTRQY